MVDRSHQVDQFLVDDPNNLLVRAQRFQDLFADGLVCHSFDEILGDIIRHVGFQQCLSDLLHAVTNVAFGDFSGAPERRKRVRQSVCDAFKHWIGFSSETEWATGCSP